MKTRISAGKSQVVRHNNIILLFVVYDCVCHHEFIDTRKSLLFTTTGSRGNLVTL